MTLPLPYAFDPNANTVDPQAVQANFEAIALQFPLSKKSQALEAPHVPGNTGEPGFLNSWTNFDTTAYQAVRFWKDPMGLVHIEGVVKGGTPGSTSVVFTLPAGYRPGNGIIAASFSAAGTAARIDIGPNGNVIVNIGSTTWTSLFIPPFRQEL